MEIALVLCCVSSMCSVSSATGVATVPLGLVPGTKQYFMKQFKLDTLKPILEKVKKKAFKADCDALRDWITEYDEYMSFEDSPEFPDDDATFKTFKGEKTVEEILKDEGLENWEYITKLFREGAECRKEVKSDLQKVKVEFGKLIKEQYPDGYDPKTSCDLIASIVGSPTIEGANPKLAKYHWDETHNRFIQNDSVVDSERLSEVCGWSESPDDNDDDESTQDSPGDTTDNTDDTTNNTGDNEGGT